MRSASAKSRGASMVFCPATAVECPSVAARLHASASASTRYPAARGASLHVMMTSLCVVGRPAYTGAMTQR